MNHNANISGKWKIETDSIATAVFLGPKNYFYLLGNNEEVIKCRGIPAKSLENVTLQTYRNVLENHEVLKLNVNMIRSVEHQLYQLVTEKLAMHDLNIGRYFSSDVDINKSVPFKHHHITGCHCDRDTENT